VKGEIIIVMGEGGKLCADKAEVWFCACHSMTLQLMRHMRHDYHSAKICLQQWYAWISDTSLTQHFALFGYINCLE
jgi:hypothetical protein